MRLKSQFRTLELGKIESEKRTVTLSFSSEEPYERYWGIEILDHSTGAIDFSRLHNGAPLLFNHNRDEVIGVVESAIVENGKGIAVVRFGNSTKAQEVFRDVEDGILKNVSVGYEIQELTKISETKGVETFRATKWLPFELSVVSIPADNTVGIGRDKDQIEKEIQVIGENMKDTKKQDDNTVDIAALQAKAREDELMRIREINALGEKLNKKEFAQKAIESGESLDGFRAKILGEITLKDNTIKTDNSDVGMSEKELQSYSFAKALKASITGDWSKAGLEREASLAVAKRMGQDARGFYIPEDALKRDLTNANATDVVGTNLLASSFIDILRNKLILNRLGTNMLTGLVGNISIPKQTGSMNTAWIDPSTGEATKSDLTLGSIGLSPKELAGYTAYSRSLLLQATPSIEMLVMNDLATSIALEIDRAGLSGSGKDGEPTGLLNTTGIGAVDMSKDAGGVNFAKVVELETTVESLNANLNGGKYVCNSAISGLLKTTEKASGYPQYLLERGEMNGYKVEVSNQVIANTLIFGDFSQMIIAMWGGLDIVTNRLNSNGMYEISAFQNVDFGVRNPESFAATTNIGQ